MKAQTHTSDSGRGIASNETSTLIAATKVKGTSVYNRTGESLGEIDDVMIDKHSGQVSYAIMSFGGFLGMGESYHPLPWQVLDYDTRRGGYVVDLDKGRLKAAPHYKRDTAPDWESGEYGRKVDDYYDIPTRSIM